MNNGYTLDCDVTYRGGGGAGNVYLNGKKIGTWQWYMDSPTCHPFYEIDKEYSKDFYKMLDSYTNECSLEYGATFFVRAFDKDFLASKFFDPYDDMWTDYLEEEPDEEWFKKYYGED